MLDCTSDPMNTPTPNDDYKVCSSGDKLTYKTPLNYITGIIIVVMFIFGFSLTAIFFFLYSEEIMPLYICFFPLFFGVVSIVLAYCHNLYYEIEIDKSNYSFISRKKKILFCFKKTRVININKIVKAKVQSNSSIFRQYGFAVLLEMPHFEYITVISEPFDKAYERDKCIDIIRKGLPQNIPFNKY